MWTFNFRNLLLQQRLSGGLPHKTDDWAFLGKRWIQTVFLEEYPRQMAYVPCHRMIRTLVTCLLPVGRKWNRICHLALALGMIWKQSIQKTGSCWFLFLRSSWERSLTDRAHMGGHTALNKKHKIILKDKRIIWYNNYGLMIVVSEYTICKKATLSSFPFWYADDSIQVNVKAGK